MRYMLRKNKPSIQLMQCGHNCVCNNCFETIRNVEEKNKCPLCRTTNRIIQRENFNK